jgi:hypothetical protein
MAPTHTALTTGVQAVSDADLLRMPGYDTRFAGGVTPAPVDTVVRATWTARLDPRAWLAALRRPTAQVSH